MCAIRWRLGVFAAPRDTFGLLKCSEIGSTRAINMLLMDPEAELPPELVRAVLDSDLPERYPDIARKLERASRSPREWPAGRISPLSPRETTRSRPGGRLDPVSPSAQGRDSLVRGRWRLDLAGIRRQQLSAARTREADPRRLQGGEYYFGNTGENYFGIDAFRIETIWLSLNSDRFIWTSRHHAATKLQLRAVACRAKLTRRQISQ